jgi:predicted nucleic acid-binding protein
MSPIVLDTDVTAGILQGKVDEQLRAWFRGLTPCITFMTVAELAKWAALRSWEPSKLAALSEWRRHIVLLPCSKGVAATWGQLQHRAQARGRPCPASQTWIAACCLVNRIPLATLKTSDFADFARYDGLLLVDPP